MSDNEPFFEDAITPVKVRTFSFSDTSVSSKEQEDSQKLSQPSMFKAVYQGAQKLQRKHACKLVSDGTGCYVAYQDYGLTNWWSQRML